MSFNNRLAIALISAFATGCLLVLDFDYDTSSAPSSSGAPPCAKTCNGTCVTSDDPKFGCAGASCDPCPLTPPHGAPQCNKTDGTCGVACDVGFDDCDSNVANGCEVDTRTDRANCGSCKKACLDTASATGRCERSACVLSCTSNASCLASPATPICRTDICLPCETDDECVERSKVTSGGPQGGGHCNGGSCAPCTVDAECASKICDVPTGLCATTGEIAYVDSQNCVAMGPPDGSIQHPYCAIADGLVKRFMLVAPNAVGTPYLDFGSGASPKAATVTIVGSGAAPADVVLNVLTARPPSVIVARHLRLSNPLDKPAANCQSGASLTLEDVSILSSHGVSSIGCSSLTLDRVVVEGKNLPNLVGVQVAAAKSRITNTTVRGYVTGVLYMADNQAATFRFNTIVHNGNVVPDGGVPGEGVRCESVVAAVLLQDSIIWDNGGPSRVNVRVCPVERVVIDTNDTTTPDGGTKSNPILDVDEKLVDTQPNAQCCIDKAITDPSVKTDRFGTPRPKGVSSDIGSHELK